MLQFLVINDYLEEKQMATLKDVARLANVNVSTVSRALNNKSYVHPETKKKIFEAVEAVGYMPNLVAKSLHQGKLKTIGVVVPSINFSVFGEIVLGIEEQARLQGYAVLVCNTLDDPEIEKEYLERLRNGLVDGIIIAGTGKNNRLLHDILSSNIAVLQIIRKQDQGIDSVSADFFECGFNSVEYLAKKGCKSIGFINGPMDISPYKDRYKGYRKAIRKYNLAEHIYESDLKYGQHFEEGFNVTTNLLKELPQLDGLMTALDMQGLGALRALKKAGKKIPEEIRLISLTGHSIGGYLETAMTSIEIPAVDMGIKTTKILIELAETIEKKKLCLQHLVFQSTLVERETT